jgi:hypothetical protein
LDRDPGAARAESRPLRDERKRFNRIASTLWVKVVLGAPMLVRAIRAQDPVTPKVALSGASTAVTLPTSGGSMATSAILCRFGTGFSAAITLCRLRDRRR